MAAQKPKSTAAANAILRMNPQLAGHITSLLDKVGPETEGPSSPPRSCVVRAVHVPD